jgi:hypothetical protein
MKRSHQEKVLAFIITLAVVAVIIKGLFMIGPLEEQRKRRFDDKRVSDLQQIESSIHYYYNENYVLPESLAELSRKRSINGSTTDPESGKPYSYRVISSDTYELCVEFSGKSFDLAEERWGHNPGKKCFRRNVLDQLR